MSRRPRLKLDGIPVHIIQRGNNRKKENSVSAKSVPISIGYRYTFMCIST